MDNSTKTNLTGKIDIRRLAEVLGDDGQKYIQAEFQKNVNQAYIKSLISNIELITKTNICLKTHNTYLSTLDDSLKIINEYSKNNIDTRILNLIIDTDQKTRFTKQINGVGISIYGLKVMIARYFKYRDAYPIRIEQQTTHTKAHHFQFNTYNHHHIHMKHKPAQRIHIYTGNTLTDRTTTTPHYTEKQQKDFNDCYEEIKMIYVMITFCSYTITDVSRSIVRKPKEYDYDHQKKDKTSKKKLVLCISQLKPEEENADVIKLMFTHLFHVHNYWLANDSNYKIIDTNILIKNDIDIIQENMRGLSDYDKQFIEWVRDTIAVFPLYILPKLFLTIPTTTYFNDLIDTANMYISPLYKITDIY
jgi:hypothetical protein